MADTQITAPAGPRTQPSLSADNPPPRHVVMDVLRRAGPRLGIGAPVLCTLDAMLSCLPPQRDHHTVFASNDTLVARRNGVSDRTIRRHVAQLVDAGLLVRRDSANRKRFMRRSRGDAACLRFGLDLSPLYLRLAELSRIAAEADAAHERLALLRSQLRAAAAARLRAAPEDQGATDALRALRRTLTPEQCEILLAALPPIAVDKLVAPHDTTEELSGNDGQNVRHHHSSNKDLIDKSGPLVISDVVEACPEATAFCPGPIRHGQDMIGLSRSLAPMMGIPSTLLRTAEDRVGPLFAAIAVMAILQMQGKIERPAAYFRAVVVKAAPGAFHPGRLVAMARGLAVVRGQRAAPC